MIYKVKRRTLKAIKLTGRPNRETVISEDDILNLRIALNTAKSFDAFLDVI